MLIQQINMRQKQEIHNSLPVNVDEKYRTLYEWKSSYSCPNLEVRKYKNVFNVLNVWIIIIQKRDWIMDCERDKVIVFGTEKEAEIFLYRNCYSSGKR